MFAFFFYDHKICTTRLKSIKKMKNKRYLHTHYKNVARKIYRTAHLEDCEIGSTKMINLVDKGINALKKIATRDTFGQDHDIIEMIDCAQNLVRILDFTEGDFTRINFTNDFPPSIREVLVQVLNDKERCREIGISESMIADVLRLIRNMTIYAVRRQRMAEGDYRPLVTRRIFPQWRMA